MVLASIISPNALKYLMIWLVKSLWLKITAIYSIVSRKLVAIKSSQRSKASSPPSGSAIARSHTKPLQNVVLWNDDEDTIAVKNKSEKKGQLKGAEKNNDSRYCIMHLFTKSLVLGDSFWQCQKMKEVNLGCQKRTTLRQVYIVQNEWLQRSW